jgi:hypothetical protein
VLEVLTIMKGSTVRMLFGELRKVKSGK